MKKFYHKHVKAAVRGVLWFVSTERNAKIHVVAAFFAISLAFLLRISNEKKLWVVLSVFLVIILEMVNTAIEKLCDKVQPEFDRHIRDIKDVSAGAVLLASVFAIVVALMVLWPEIMLLFQQSYIE
jgi:diacylglycerol kinase (ATP)